MPDNDAAVDLEQGDKAVGQGPPDYDKLLFERGSVVRIIDMVLSLIQKIQVAGTDGVGPLGGLDVALSLQHMLKDIILVVHLGGVGVMGHPIGQIGVGDPGQVDLKYGVGVYLLSDDFFTEGIDEHSAFLHNHIPVHGGIFLF